MAVGRTPGEITSRIPSELEAAGYVNQYGLSRKHLFEAVKASLKRLQLDYIDLYWCKARSTLPARNVSLDTIRLSQAIALTITRPLKKRYVNSTRTSTRYLSSVFRCKHCMTLSRRDTYAISA